MLKKGCKFATSNQLKHTMMNIQKFSELVSMMAKIEAKRDELQDLNYNMDVLTDQAAANNFVYDDESRDNYLAAYDRKKKAERQLKKALADFRKAVESDEDTAWYASQCRYAADKSDIAYYDRVKWNILKDATNVKCSNYTYYIS
jgi:hypothetical protein